MMNAQLLKNKKNTMFRLQEACTCAGTLAIMSDPVICADGNTYERAFIEEWLQSHDISPRTNEKLAHKHLIPNIILRSVLDEIPPS
jgi:hypothetical protein